MANEHRAASANDRETSAASLMPLIKAQDWKAIEKILSASPEDANVRSVASLFRSKSSCFPLHYLCKKPKAPLSLMLAMIEAAPAATASKDTDTKSLPMHVACWYEQPLESVRALLKANPSCLSSVDKDGNLPLHIAASLSSPQVVELLLDANPNMSIKLNKKKQTPLHCACLRRDMSASVIEKLLQAAPDAASTRDWMYRCPVHDACMNYANTDILEPLLNAFPGVILLFDKQGLTPYRMCRERLGLPLSAPSVALIRKYMKKYSPGGIRIRNKFQFLAEDIKSSLGMDHSKSLNTLKKLPK